MKEDSENILNEEGGIDGMFDPLFDFVPEQILKALKYYKLVPEDTQLPDNIN